MNYAFGLVLVLLVLIYLYNTNKKMTVENPKVNQQLEEQKTENRPLSGELNFNK